MKKIFFLLVLLFLITLNSVLKAQKEHPYISLFDTNKVWYSVQPLEFGGYQATVERLNYKNPTLNVNDTLYYGFQEPIKGSGYREDTATRRIYYRAAPNYPEKLIYDFSIQEGDSIYISESRLWLYVDSIRTKTFFEKERKVYYLTNKEWEAQPIWIEGIGSLAGFAFSTYPPQLEWWGGIDSYLTCCYNNDSLIYEDKYGEIYGCSFEYFDASPPILDSIWFEPDTVSFAEPVYLYFTAHDDLSEIIPNYLCVHSPSNRTYYYTYTHFSQDTFRIKIDSLTGPGKFWNETGEWKLAFINLVDSLHNEELFRPENVSFYVKEIYGIPETTLKNVELYPNPVSDEINIKIDNFERADYTLSIFNEFGEKKYSEIISRSEFSVSVKNLSNGVYFYTISNNNKLVFIKKIIVKH